MRIKITNIEWDLNKEDLIANDIDEDAYNYEEAIKKLNLPTETEIDIDLPAEVGPRGIERLVCDPAELICDALTDQYGFLIKDYIWEIKE